MGSLKKAKVVKKTPARKKAKAQAKKAKPRKSSLTLVNFKVSSKDLKAIMANAKKHAGGNYSAWLRHAGLQHTPKRGEVIR